VREPLHTPMRSGAVAKLLGISTDTLRLYERQKLFERLPRSPNGYRSYSPNIIQRVRVIRTAIALGFTVDELRSIFAQRDAQKAPCEQVRRLAEEKLRKLEAHIQELGAMRRCMQAVLRQWDAALARTPKVRPAHLLESLTGAVEPQARKLRLQWSLAVASNRRRKS
jgi:DNA-binding transcriptional MerR regulator